MHVTGITGQQKLLDDNEVKLGLFDLANGRTLLSEFVYTRDLKSMVLSKPLVLNPVKDAAGRSGYEPRAYIGERVELYVHQIVALNTETIDNNIKNLYIQATTGIEVATSVP